MVKRQFVDGWQSKMIGALMTEFFVADFTGWESDNAKFEEQFGRVVKALRTDVQEALPKA